MSKNSATLLALSLIKQFEGFRSSAYKCPAGVWTVGYGCTGYDRYGDEINSRTVWTEEFATQELSIRVDALIFKLSSALRVSVTDNQLAALTSLAYNVGIAALQKSKLWSKLNAGDPISAADEFLDWDMAGGVRLPGLTARRRIEHDVYLDGLSNDEALEAPEECRRDGKCSQFFGWLSSKFRNKK